MHGSDVDGPKAIQRFAACFKELTRSAQQQVLARSQAYALPGAVEEPGFHRAGLLEFVDGCLLYTSDAADDM
eukprot:13632705-Alexandrium_andersonii.AAC.1